MVEMLILLELWPVCIDASHFDASFQGLKRASFAADSMGMKYPPSEGCLEVVLADERVQELLFCRGDVGLVSRGRCVAC